MGIKESIIYSLMILGRDIWKYIQRVSNEIQFFKDIMAQFKICLD